MEQETSPGTTLIEGGKAKIEGQDGQIHQYDLVSFYIGTTEEPNIYYLTYLDFIKKYYSKATYEAALPDTTVWMEETIEDSMKDYLVRNYLRHERFHYFPVVGLNITQINKYLEWKTDRVNEFILIREGVMIHNPNPADSSEIFSTQSHIEGQFDAPGIQKLPDLDPDNSGRKSDGRLIRMEDGILLPSYRLPTAREWKWAALEISSDGNQSYVKTPNQMKEFQKSNYFVTLDPHTRKSKPDREYSYLESGDHSGLSQVHYGSTGNYKVLHMLSNVPELVQGGNVIRTSWKCPAFNIFGQTKQTINSVTIDDPHVEDSTSVGAVGFRVAVNRVGAYLGDVKRRKVEN